MADATTASKTLTDAYQLIIAGACMVTLEQGTNARVHFGSSLPANDAAFHGLNNLNSPVSYTGGLNVYAKRDNDRTGTTTTVISYTGV